MPVPIVTCETCNANLPLDHIPSTLCVHHRESCLKYKDFCCFDSNERTERCDGCGADIPYNDLVKHIIENHIFY